MKKIKKNIIHITSEFSLKNYSITTFILFLINKLNKSTENKIFVENITLKTDLSPTVPFLINGWIFLILKIK